MAKKARRLNEAKPAATRDVRCYDCGHRFEVSVRTMSTPCPACHHPLKIEDVVVKSYLPVNALQTCGKIRVTKRGRVVAKRIESGDGIDCQGTLEGEVETPGNITLGPKAKWKGSVLHAPSLTITDGAVIEGVLRIPGDFHRG